MGGELGEEAQDGRLGAPAGAASHILPAQGSGIPTAMGLSHQLQTPGRLKDGTKLAQGPADPRQQPWKLGSQVPNKALDQLLLKKCYSNGKGKKTNKKEAKGVA